MEPAKDELQKVRPRESWREWDERLEKLITRKNELQDDIMYWRKTIDMVLYETEFKEEIDLMDIGGAPDYSIISLRGMEEYSKKNILYITNDIIEL